MTARLRLCVSLQSIFIASYFSTHVVLFNEEEKASLVQTGAWFCSGLDSCDSFGVCYARIVGTNAFIVTICGALG